MSELTVRDEAYWSNEKKLALLEEVPPPCKADKALLNRLMVKCKMTGLNPFLKEIGVIKFGSRYELAILARGQKVIAHRTQEYIGMRIEEELDDNKKPVWIKAIVIRNVNGHVAEFECKCFLSEYKGGAKWNTAPYMMLRKCAVVGALREAFMEIDGLYAPEEADHVNHKQEIVTVNEVTKEAEDLFA